MVTSGEFRGKKEKESSPAGDRFLFPSPAIAWNLKEEREDP